MRGIQFYVSQVLQTVSVMADGLADVISVEKRPQSTERADTILVISLPISFTDNGVWQSSVLRFDIYVRDKQGGVADVLRLQTLLDGVVALFPLRGERFSAYDPTLVLCGSDDLGFTRWVVQANILVNTTDRI